MPARKRSDYMNTKNGRDASYRLRHFALEYLKDGNATSAAKRVGYSARSAESIGCRLLRNIKVQAIIAEKLKEAEANAETVLRELYRLATVDVTAVFTDAGEVKPFSVWTPAQRAALAGFEVVKKNAEAGDGHTDIVHKMKFHPKSPPLEMLMRHHRLLGDQPEKPAPHVGFYFGLPEDRRVDIE